MRDQLISSVVSWGRIKNMLTREKSPDLDLSCLLTILPGVSALLSEVGVGGVKTCHTQFTWKLRMEAPAPGINSLIQVL